ncbi:hypothetical protein MKP09_13075 [Niabella ginsengisoli]|uniref:Uncharacterized protein n=1 Tax=Niabella ginsengisoli TaxID=522298 RepID=A0ABS9SK68_9BACT|nr:hypothetical protein [Niabella ginsengisoli]MCH5598771.1 hypothetical protein [Niabella ginsengisoli]
MVWDNKGNQSTYSKISYWRMGLLKTDDWKGAKWIAYDVLPDSNQYIPLMHGNGKKHGENDRMFCRFLEKILKLKNRQSRDSLHFWFRAF